MPLFLYSCQYATGVITKQTDYGHHRDLTPGASGTRRHQVIEDLKPVFIAFRSPSRVEPSLVCESMAIVFLTPYGTLERAAASTRFAVSGAVR